MADNDQLLKQIGKLFEAEREQTKKIVRAETEPIKSDVAGINKRLDGIEKGQKEHGKKLDILLTEATSHRAAIETLDTKIDATKTEVDEIKQRQRPRHAD